MEIIIIIIIIILIIIIIIINNIILRCHIPEREGYYIRQREGQREGYYIRQIGTFNQLVSGRTREEVEKIYFENNREKIKQELIMKKIKK